MKRLAISVIVFVAMMAPALTASATDIYEIDLPYRIIGGTPGSQTVLFDGPAPGAGELCSVRFVTANDISIHPGVNLLVVGGGTTVIVPDIEQVPGGTTYGSEAMIHTGTIQVIHVQGTDGISSLEGRLTLECQPLTTTVPPTTTITTTTEPTTTTVTTGPPSTTTTTPSTTTSEPPTPTTSTTTPTTTTPSTSVPPTTPPPIGPVDAGGGGTVAETPTAVTATWWIIGFVLVGSFVAWAIVYVGNRRP